MIKTNTAAQPWYRYPFVWLLIALPASAVIGGFITFWIAARTHDGLVTDDYYKRGNEINQDLHRDHAARAMGIHARVMLGQDRQTLRIIFDQPITDPLQIRLMHPTRAGLDQTADLALLSPQMHLATLAQALDQPNWLIEIADTQGKWRLRSEWKIESDQALQLKPDD